MFIIIVFRLGGNKLFSCFLAGFLLFSPKGSVTRCDSSLKCVCFFLESRMIHHFAFTHLISGYYYYDYVVIGGLKRLWLN